MAKKTQSASQKGFFAAYKQENRYTRNKQLRIAKHLKKHPTDVKAADVVVSSTPTRKPSSAKVWNSNARMLAGLYRMFYGKGNGNLAINGHPSYHSWGSAS